MEVRGFINEIDGKLSPEFLGKFSKAQQEKLERISKQKNDEIQKVLKKQREEREKLARFPSIQQINIKEDAEKIKLEEINKLYSIDGPKQKIASKHDGQIVGEHKTKLGFIFIGDSSAYAGDPKALVSVPKISMAVGGVLQANNKPDGQINEIDPRSDNLIGVASQFHLLSLTDVDVTGIFNDNEKFVLKKRSSIKAEADILELYSNEAVLIRSLGRPYKSGTGARTLTPGGVHIISGMHTKDKPLNLEPMVLGKTLSDVLSEMVGKISDINSVLINMNEDLLNLKLSLISHTHPVFTTGAELAAAVAIAVATGGSAPLPLSAIGTPSIGLATQVSPTIATSTVRNITNTYSHLINLELLKTNNLTPLSEKNFLSQFNRVN